MKNTKSSLFIFLFQEKWVYTQSISTLEIIVYCVNSGLKTQIVCIFSISSIRHYQNVFPYIVLLYNIIIISVSWFSNWSGCDNWHWNTITYFRLTEIKSIFCLIFCLLVHIVICFLYYLLCIVACRMLGHWMNFESATCLIRSEVYLQKCQIF